MYPIEFFLRGAQRFGNRVALVQGATSITYSELHSIVRAAAAGLCTVDEATQTRVAICAGNSISHVIALLATLASGKTWVPLNPRNGNSELDRGIAFTDPTIIICDKANAGRLSSGGAAMIIVGQTHLDTDGGDDSFAALIRRHADQPLPELRGAPEDVQAIKFTGGTTGIPKGVMQSYRNWNVCAATLMSCLGPQSAHRYLVVAPLTHGTSSYMLPVLACGGCLVIPQSVSPGAILDDIQAHAITTLFMPPTLIYSVLAEQKARARDLASLRHLIYSAAPMRIEKILEARVVFGDVVATAYGQTEAPSVATFMRPAEFLDQRNTASVGRATLLTEVAILDAEGQRVAPGQMGEVAIRGDLVMSGYWRMPEKTAETIRDGWLFTGDIGVLDERGYLYLKDRSRDVIITGGFNVYPVDVENVLGRHPAVYDCSVVGIPDERWGEAVHAAVQLRSGHSATDGELIQFVKRELDSVKAPKAVHFFAELPRSGVDKVARTDLRRMIGERHAANSERAADHPEADRK